MLQHTVELKQSIFLNIMYLPLIPFFTYLNLDAEGMVILGMLLFMDFLVGVCKAYILKTPITYERAVAGILSKVFVLLIPIVLAFMVLVVTHVDLTYYLKYVISALVIAESYSILGNIVAIRTKGKRNELDLISFVIRGFREFMEKLLLGFRR